MGRSVAAEWAILGKQADSPDYRIVSASGPQERFPQFTRLIEALLPGVPAPASDGGPAVAGQPLVTFAAARGGQDATVDVCVTLPADRLDLVGREFSQSVLYRLPAQAVRAQSAGFTALWRTVRSAPEPVPGQSLQLELVSQPWEEIAAAIDGGEYSFDWCAATAAALLERPVAIKPATPLTTDLATRILDAVSCLLPRGYRSALDAGTAVDGLAEHRLRLVFATHAQGAALKVGYAADGDESAEPQLGDLGHAYLRALRDLRAETGSASAVTRALWALDEPHEFGPEDERSGWALEMLRRRNLARNVLRDITDGNGLLRRAPGGALAPETASAMLRREVGQLLIQDTQSAEPDSPQRLSTEQRVLLYEYLARGPFPEELPRQHWSDPLALDTVAAVASELLATPQPADPRQGDPPTPSTALRFVGAAPPDVLDETMSRLFAGTARPGSGPAGLPEPLLDALARQAPALLDSATSRTATATGLARTRDVVAAQPDLVLRTVAAHLDDPAGLGTLVRFVAAAANPEPWLRQLSALLGDTPSQSHAVDPEELAAEDAARPGFVELLLQAAAALGRIVLVLPVTWPALLRGAAAPEPRAGISRAGLQALNERWLRERTARTPVQTPAGSTSATPPPAALSIHPHTSPDSCPEASAAARVDARLDVLSLLSAAAAEPNGTAETPGIGLRLWRGAYLLNRSGFPIDYLIGLAHLWSEQITEPLHDRIAERFIAALAAATRAGSTAAPTTPTPAPVSTAAALAAITQVLYLCSDPQPRVEQALVRLRGGSFPIDDLPERFWTGLGARHPALSDPHWIARLESAAKDGSPEPVARLWPAAVAGGLSEETLLKALGPWPRRPWPGRLPVSLRPGPTPSLRWCARTDELIDLLRLPESFSPAQADMHRARLRDLLKSGVWGSRAGTSFTLFYQRKAEGDPAR